MNDKKKIAAMINYLKNCLLEKNYTAQFAHQTINVYIFNVSKYDQDKLYSMFCSEQSNIWIVVITTVLEMSMNISDIDMIVQWNISLTNNIDDL